MKNYRLLLVVGLLSVATLFSCKKDEEPVPTTDVTLTLVAPENVELGDPTTIKVEFQNKSTKVKTLGNVTEGGKVTATVEQGVYQVTVDAKGNLSSQGSDETNAVELRGLEDNLSISGSSYIKNVDLFLNVGTKGWVFKEIYFAGSKTPAGKSYYKDKYFELYNNTDKILYADGLCISESDHTNSISPNKWEEMLDEAFVAYTVYQIPGNGTDYPVLPGESLVLADLGIDHTVDNANSINLSNADFEWYDEHMLDTDTPEVPNLFKAFSGSASIYTPHGRGYKAWVVFNPEMDINKYLMDNEVEYTAANGNVIKRIKVPNDKILDAVEAGNDSKFKSKAVSASLDVSYANVGADTDLLYGKVIRRKVKETVEGRVVYEDTNDSSYDFDVNVDPQPKQ